MCRVLTKVRALVAAVMATAVGMGGDTTFTDTAICGPVWPRSRTAARMTTTFGTCPFAAGVTTYEPVAVVAILAERGAVETACRTGSVAFA